MRRIRRWLTQYVTACYLLWDYGEKAWPWNVAFVWTYVGNRIKEGDTS